MRRKGLHRRHHHPIPQPRRRNVRGLLELPSPEAHRLAKSRAERRWSRGALREQPGREEEGSSPAGQPQ